MERIDLFAAEVRRLASYIRAENLRKPYSASSKCASPQVEHEVLRASRISVSNMEQFLRSQPAVVAAETMVKVLEREIGKSTRHWEEYHVELASWQAKRWLSQASRWNKLSDARQIEGGYCAICLMEIEDDVSGCRPCTNSSEHVFHRACIGTWWSKLQQEQLPHVCPLCKCDLHDAV